MICEKHHRGYTEQSPCYLCYQEEQNRIYRERKAAEAEALLSGTNIGDFLYTTWGYEQTNVTFWQVTRKTAKCLFGREVENTEVEYKPLAMAGTAYPVKDNFKTPEARINLTKVRPYLGNGVSCSWYG